MMTRERVAELRALVEDESMSWGDIAELQGAFEEIDPATLPEPAENAGWGDMLDEIEARLGSNVDQWITCPTHGYSLATTDRACVWCLP